MAKPGATLELMFDIVNGGNRPEVIDVDAVGGGTMFAGQRAL